MCSAPTRQVWGNFPILPPGNSLTLCELMTNFGAGLQAGRLDFLRTFSSLRHFMYTTVQNEIVFKKSEKTYAFNVRKN